MYDSGMEGKNSNKNHGNSKAPEGEKPYGKMSVGIKAKRDDALDRGKTDGQIFEDLRVLDENGERIQRKKQISNAI